MNILCYQYEADSHCIECTVKRYKANGETKREVIKYLVYDEWSETHFDENDISYNCFDSEGNPILITDEWQELDESYISENPVQYLVCGTCHEIIDTYQEIKGESNA